METNSNRKSLFDVQLIFSVQGINEVQLEWEEFLQSDSRDSKFWQDPCVLSLNPELVDNGAEIIIILLRRNGRIECIAPCSIKKKKFSLKISVLSFGGPRVRILKIIGGDFIYSKNTDIDSCVKAILVELKKLDMHFELIEIENLEETSSLMKLFNQAGKKNLADFQLNIISPKKEFIWRHILANSYEEWIASLGKSTRRLVRRRVKNLYEQYPGQIELITVTNKESVPMFLSFLDDLFPKTWQAKTFGSKKRNNNKEVDFYKRIADFGWLRNYILLINGQPVAFFTGTQYAHSFDAQEIGYDPAFSSSGVGAALSYMVLEDLYTHNKPKVLDFGFGENIYKNLICNEKKAACCGCITTSNLCRFLVKFQIILNYIENKIRYFLAKYGLDNNLRKLLKRR